MPTIRFGLVHQPATALCIALLFTIPGFANDPTEPGGFLQAVIPVNFYDDVVNESSACGAAGCSACSVGCSGCNDGCKLFGIVAPTPPCFGGFISPMTNPLFFEDPRTLTEMRIIFAHHDIPSDTIGGGDVQYLAVQLRAALTERLSFIATKDGFIFGQPNAHPDGWSDVAAGLKIRPSL